MEIVGYVYKITNLVNFKVYIGITTCTLKKRWNEHRHAALKNKKYTHLCLAIKKYGQDNFKIDQIKKCYSYNDLYRSEIYFIKHFESNNRSKGYNNSTGGEHSAKGIKHSVETRKKISEIQKGRHNSPGTEFGKGEKHLNYGRSLPDCVKEKISKSHIGKKLSEKTKEKLRKYKGNSHWGYGKKLSDETKAKISKANKGRKHTDEFKRKISLLKRGNKNMLGKKHTEESKEKNRIAHLGKKKTSEQKRKISKSIKKWWSKRKNK